VRERRGPWLSGLILAVLGTVWLIAQVIGGVVAWVEGELVDPPLVAPANAPAW